MTSSTNAARDLAEALRSLLNVEGAATQGAAHFASYMGLDVAYHFNKARAALAAYEAERADQRACHCGETLIVKCGCCGAAKGEPCRHEVKTP